MWCSAVGVIVTLALSLLAAPLVTDAQPVRKMYRIGLLYDTPAGPGANPSLKDFRQGLRDLGYVEGQNIVLELRWAEGSEARLHELAAELVQLPVDVLVPGGTRATRAAQHATRTIPIVMLVGADPVAAGLIASLGHPGGNMTGLSSMTADLSGKQLEFLKEAVPQLARVAVLANPSLPGHRRLMEHLAGAAAYSVCNCKS